MEESGHKPRAYHKLELCLSAYGENYGAVCWETGQLVPKSSRTPNFTPKLSRTQVKSYPSQVVPKLTHTLCVFPRRIRQMEYYGEFLPGNVAMNHFDHTVKEGKSRKKARVVLIDLFVIVNVEVFSKLKKKSLINISFFIKFYH